MSSFWHQHEKAEELLKLEEIEKAKEQERNAEVAKGRVRQNAPARCAFCGHEGDDVILWVCPTCA